MASINAVLTAENGDDLYPETYDDYVLDSNGEALSTRLGSRSEASGVSGTSAFEKISTLNSDLAYGLTNTIIIEKSSSEASSATQFTVSDISQYSAILVACLNGGKTSLNTPGFCPMALFKDGLPVIGANTAGGYYASAKYISDTKLELVTTGSYIRVYGLKY